jgi:hypothetical protein
VRFYNQSRLSANDLRTIQRVANRIWAPYGIVIDAVTNAGGINVVVAGDLDAAPASEVAAPAVIGTTLFSDGHATPNIRLSEGAAEQLLNWRNDPAPPVARPIGALRPVLPRVLGVALAHELAHYLLDTPDHSSEGLLRERLSLAEMEGGRPSQLWLSCLQQRALSRCAARMARPAEPVGLHN